jgi:hypothetical protein
LPGNSTSHAVQFTWARVQSDRDRADARARANRGAVECGVATVEWYEGTGACPGCGDIHYIADQTKLFAPFGSSSTYRVGVEATTEVYKEMFTDRIWEDSWWRLREPTGQPEINVLHDLWDVVRCDCGLRLAAVLRFRVILPDKVTLVAIVMLDINDPDLARSIDLVGDDWNGTYSIVPLAELVAAPFEERAAMLARVLATICADRFGDETVSSISEEAVRATTLVGLVQCQACGTSRERQVETLLTSPAYAQRDAHSFFGSPWRGGTIYLGSRVPVGPDAEVEQERVALSYTRLRAGDPAALTILGALTDYGCACGAGRGSVVQRFVRHGDQLELVELVLRVVTTAADLADIDYSEHHWRGDSTRDSLLRAIAAAR